MPTPIPGNGLAGANCPRRHCLATLATFSYALLAPAGCALIPRPPTVPMPSSELSGDCPAGGARPLLVLLPGAYSRPEEFNSEGFVPMLREQRISADVRLADAHLGYFHDGSILTRLHHDVLLPALQATPASSPRPIWLVGISLGGFAALLYAARKAHELPAGTLAGVVALAPYLGRRELLREIESTGDGGNSGSAAAWAGVPARPDSSLPERELWAWLAAQALLPPAQRLPLHLGYGQEDRFADGHRLLARWLPATGSHSVPGGHDWPAWRALWQHWLAQAVAHGALRQGCT